VATVDSMSNRLRYELGDIGRSFVYQFVADGTTNRFLIPYSPLDGVHLAINQEGEDVSADVEVEEATGHIVFDTTPAAGDVIIVAGNYFKYFTETEVCQYINDAFAQHTTFHTDSYGRTMTVANLPTVEEYPVIIYASTLALYTLATDASFDIDIQAPDGVMIPRSERYRQLMQMIEVRKNQYKELCSQLGIGLYKIDVFSLRRISKTTNEYVPVFEPQEIDNKSPKTRVRLPIPTYGNVKPTPTTVVQDLNIYEGDDYEFSIRLDFEVDNLTPLAEIRSLPGAAVVFAEFTVTKPNITEDGDNQRTLVLSLTGEQTRLLPGKSYYDVQLTDAEGVTHTYVSGIIFVTKEVSQ
jgi:predicted heme/steroid binding protein